MLWYQLSTSPVLYMCTIGIFTFSWSLNGTIVSACMEMTRCIAVSFSTALQYGGSCWYLRSSIGFLLCTCAYVEVYMTLCSMCAWYVGDHVYVCVYVYTYTCEQCAVV